MILHDFIRYYYYTLNVSKKKFKSNILKFQIMTFKIE